MGTLRIHGSIDTSQFWPHGSSDGDINSIQFEIKENSIEYKEDKQGGFSITDVFKDATSIGQVKKSVIYTKRGGNQTIQIRLQGVDTPVLFYMGAPLKKSNDVSNEKRTKFNSINQVVRQCFAESSTFAFVKHLDNI